MRQAAGARSGRMVGMLEIRSAELIPKAAAVVFALAALLLTIGTVGVARAQASQDPWSGLAPATPSYPTDVEATNVQIPMDDGALLSADVYRPATAANTPAPGRFPVIVIQTPYGAIGTTGMTTGYAEYGYVEVDVDVRGTGSSEGDFSAFGPREQRDYYEVVQWAAKQSWSDGKVGVDGFSYEGAASNRTAAMDPPALKAAVTGSNPPDIFHDFISEGGVVSETPYGWATLELAGLVPDPSDLEGNPQPSANALAQRTVYDNDGLDWRFNTFSPWFTGEADWDNEFDQQRTLNVSKIKVPTLVYTGFHDLFLNGTQREYDELRLKPGSGKQLVIGDWGHLSPKTLENNMTIFDMNVAWFNHILKGENNGVQKLGPVTLQNLPGDQWQRFSEWPPASVRYRRLYLTGARSGTAVSLNDGGLSADQPTTPGSDTGQLNPATGVCSRDTITFIEGEPADDFESVGGTSLNNPCYSEQRQDEVTSFTYTSQPFNKGTQIVGPIGMTLRASSTADDAVWVAKLSDVAPDGTVTAVPGQNIGPGLKTPVEVPGESSSTPVTEGMLLTSDRAYNPSKTIFAPNGDPLEPWQYDEPNKSLAVTPGTPVTMHFEILPTDWTLQPGHRLRLTISGSDTPTEFPSEQTYEREGIATVYRGPAHQASYLTIPFLAPAG
jgi:uncharacterized protein